MNRLIGLVVAAAGVAVLWFGWEAYESVGSKLSRLVEGAPSTKALIMFAIGGVLVLIGLFMANRPNRRR